MIYGIALVLSLMSTPFVDAAELHQELQETVRAEVIEIISERTEDIIGTDTDAMVQEVRVRVEEGARRGSTITFENDMVPLRTGDDIFINRLENINGVEYFQLKDVRRHTTLTVLGLSVALLLFVCAGWYGLRAILSLGLSVVCIFYVLVPLLLEGYPALWVSIGVAGPILAFLLFSTHGFHSRIWIAFAGTSISIVLTGIVAWYAVASARLTGLSSDAAIYLNFSTAGELDFTGLLLGGIIIGMLGVLDDVAVTQSSVVRELTCANQTLSFRELYLRALRVGRDHIGSLVNTLALAYTGVSLPIILLMVQANAELALSINQEIVAVELIRMGVGSLGLIATVPITTFIACLWYSRYPEEYSDGYRTHQH